MALTLASAARLLSEYGLLREIIQGDDWTLDAQAVNGFDKPFGSITYDTRQVVSNTLLCCKGRFKAEYLDGIDDRGLDRIRCGKTISPRRRKLRELNRE